MGIWDSFRFKEMRFENIIVRHETLSGKYIFMEIQKLENGKYRWSVPWNEKGEEIPILLFDRGYGIKKPYSNKQSALNAVKKCGWKIDRRED